jgi:hypothetical protein
MKKALEDNAKNIPLNKNLTEAQSRQANALEKLGVPATIASQIAAIPEDHPDIKKQQDRFKGLTASAAPAANPRKEVGSALYFDGGKGLNAAKKTESAKENPFAKFLNPNKEDKKNESGSVLNFAEKATDKASINTNSDINLFDIISRRYQMSGHKRLNDE